MNDLLRRWLNLPPQASTYARGVDILHYFVIGTTLLGTFLVSLFALYLLARYRLRVPNATTANASLPLGTEIVIVSSILGLFLSFWVVGAVQYNHMRTPPANAMTVYVTAKQWMWKFSYPSGRASMDVLTVPAHRPVKLVMTSRDVIHSFYVPAFRMKQDVVPGRYYTAWFEATSTGQYALECAEYCGVSHSQMGGTIQVLSDADYARWLDGQNIEVATNAFAMSTRAGSDLVSVGRDVAARRGCFSCHTIDGQPHIGPTWAGLYGSEVKLIDDTTVVADEAYLTRSMMEPEVQIVRGYKPIMPTYLGLIEEPEVAALVEYIKALASKPIAPTVILPRVTPEEDSGLPEKLP